MHLCSNKMPSRRTLQRQEEQATSLALRKDSISFSSLQWKSSTSSTSTLYTPNSPSSTSPFSSSPKHYVEAALDSNFIIIEEVAVVGEAVVVAEVKEDKSDDGDVGGGFRIAYGGCGD